VSEWERERERERERKNYTIPSYSLSAVKITSICEHFYDVKVCTVESPRETVQRVYTSGSGTNVKRYCK
jgi:hypothetical protein